MSKPSAAQKMFGKSVAIRDDRLARRGGGRLGNYSAEIIGCSNPGASRGCQFTRQDLGLGGANDFRLYRDQPLDCLHLAFHEKNIRDLDRLDVGAAGRKRQIAGAQAQNDIME